MSSLPRAPLFRRVGVLGAGVMGRSIAAHLANAGLEVLLLDLPATEPTAAQAQRGLSAEDRAVRDRLAIEAIASLPKTRPAPLFDPGLARQIRPGNLEDDLAALAECDWIIEVIVERLDIKRELFAKLEAACGEKPVFSSNTSGIPIAAIAEGRGESFRRRFLGTHFFNPPRYMHLLEIIPGPDTDADLLAGLSAFAEQRLGKGVVIAKDRPNFIANRIGCYGVLRTVELMQEHGLGVDAVDFLTGPFMGRAKSATFRTSDLVGLDVLLHVADNVRDGAPDDPEIETFNPSPLLTRMVEEKRLGEKTGAGFFKKIKREGKSVIQTLDVESFEYRDRQKAKFPEVAALKGVDDLRARLRALYKTPGKGAAFCWAVLRDTLRYAAAVGPEIADDIPAIDRAMRWGFGWELGPFELWDVLGLSRVVERMEEEGRPAPEWVQAHLRTGATSFYQSDDEGHHVLQLGEGRAPLAERPGVLDLHLPTTGIARIESNKGASLWDLGDGVMGLEFHSKMNSVGGDILAMVNKAITRAEDEFDAMVVGNQGANFSVGANVALLLMAALEGEWEDIDLMVRQFQRATVGLRRCARPVVVAPFGLTLGGGCEFTLHGDKVHASAELYTGLVEGGVGLIPAGGGCKEFYLRMLERLGPGADPVKAAQAAFEVIGLAKVSTSAEEARGLGFLRPTDSYALNRDRVIAGAKAEALALAHAGYRAPAERTDIPVSGREGYALLEVGLHNYLAARHISEHDRVIGRKLARIITGGDVAPGSKVSEQHLLDLERECFLSLCSERKSLERIQFMLKKGKPLRN